MRSPTNTTDFRKCPTLSFSFDGYLCIHFMVSLAQRNKDPSRVSTEHQCLSAILSSSCNSRAAWPGGTRCFSVISCPEQIFCLSVTKSNYLVDAHRTWPICHTYSPSGLQLSSESCLNSGSREQQRGKCIQRCHFNEHLWLRIYKNNYKY